MKGRGGCFDALLWAIGAAALVLAFIYPRFAPLHFAIAFLLLAVGTVRLLRKLDA
jgi:membrane-bound ClpP family serine protease